MRAPVLKPMLRPTPILTGRPKKGGEDVCEGKQESILRSGSADDGEEESCKEREGTMMKVLFEDAPDRRY